MKLCHLQENGTGYHHVEISQPQKDKYHMFSLTCSIYIFFKVIIEEGEVFENRNGTNGNEQRGQERVMGMNMTKYTCTKYHNETHYLFYN
jgi:hypothetical protein